VNKKFVVHHVGARNGSRGFPVIKKLESDIVTVFYEASEDGNDQILLQAKRNGAMESILVNACIGSRHEVRNFYFNRDPFMSSLYPANEDYFNFYEDLLNYDNLMGQILEPVEVLSVNTLSLDEVISTKQLPACDFLSIDVQGGELDVLKGSENSLRDASGVLLEVEFSEMYQGQPLFGEIDKFLRIQGFKFIRFLGFQEWAPRTVSIDGRGRKMHVAADALYLKDWKCVKEEKIDTLIFSAISFGQTEFALEVVRQKNFTTSGFLEGSWRAFVYKFIMLARGLNEFPPTFSDVYSIDQSLGRFKENYTPPSRKNAIAEGFFRLWRSVPVSIRSKAKQALRSSGNLVKSFQRLMSRSSELEKHFSGAGLKSVANELRKSRLRG
jgi:FkbM family methyltransferase